MHAYLLLCYVHAYVINLDNRLHTNAHYILSPLTHTILYKP